MWRSGSAANRASTPKTRTARVLGTSGEACCWNLRDDCCRRFPPQNQSRAPSAGFSENVTRSQQAADIKLEHGLVATHARCFLLFRSRRFQPTTNYQWPFRIVMREKRQCHAYILNSEESVVISGLPTNPEVEGDKPVSGYRLNSRTRSSH
jgi:hypothetical protein